MANIYTQIVVQIVFSVLGKANVIATFHRNELEKLKISPLRGLVSDVDKSASTKIVPRSGRTELANNHYASEFLSIIKIPITIFSCET